MIEIIKASAGSGKTYMLAFKYVEMLMWAERDFLLHDQGWVHNVHRRTLAITFTNNSTNEMKERIVQALYDIKCGKQEDYIEWIVNSFKGVAERERIMLVAGRLLEEMLEDWQMVRVSTIDSFFNQVVNAFVHELGIDDTPAVDLDSKAILEQAVDNMLSKLESVSPEGKALVRFLSSMVDEALSDGRKWNIRSQLVEIAKQVLRQKDKDDVATESVMELKVVMQRRLREMDEQVESLWKEVRARIEGMDGLKAYCRNAIVNGSISGKSIKDAVNDPEKWFNKGKGSREEGEWLSMKCGEIVELLDGEESRTIRSLLEGINFTGVIAELGREVECVCRENDCIMMSTVNELINEIVRNSTTPFIYEKTGLGTDHYMIDEFQDTSVTQWENFVPLIGEGNAQGKQSLVVGDVKQSIYRWREGNWRILQEGVRREFDKQCCESTLTCNFRSSAPIVRFNNQLYKNIVDQMKGVFGESLSVVYADVRQDVADKNMDKTGGVRALFMKEKTKGEFYDRAIPKIVEWVKVHEKGCAVLVRKNEEAMLVAKKLAEASVPFVSSESLLVVNDVAVRFVTAMMNYMIASGDVLAEARLRSLSRCVTAKDEIDIQMVDRLSRMPLEEMTMAVVRRYALDQIDGGAHRIFVYTLADLIRGWVRNNDGSVNRWLEYWQEKCSEVCVPLPKNDDAVVVMTIHKSKGLQFSNVALLMSANEWECGISSSARHKSMMRVDLPASLSSSQVHRAFININSKRVEGSSYDSEQKSEWEECCIDDLNTLYVATTRAVNEMFIVGNRGIEPSVRYKNFCLVNVLEQAMRGWGDELIDLCEDEESVEMGEMGEMGRERGEGALLGDLPEAMSLRVPKTEEQRRGIEVHEWLAGIRYEDEVGALDGELSALWAEVRLTGWFSREWEQVMNETEIACSGRIMRPDRVMIRGNKAVVVDWKTGEHSEKYDSQMRDYCKALCEMGLETEGWLCYLGDCEMVRVV